MTYLLDVNVLLAMSYIKHDHHDRAEEWFNKFQADNVSMSLATCSITELGFVRIASGAAGFSANVKLAQEELKILKTRRRFVFLDDCLGANHLPDWAETSKHVTDGHLVALASVHRGRLVTLDEGIPGALLIPRLPEVLGVREPIPHYQPTRFEVAPWPSVREADRYGSAHPRAGMRASNSIPGGLASHAVSRDNADRMDPRSGQPLLVLGA